MKIILPLAVFVPRKTMPPKKYIINLNNYRNWSFIVNNIVKKAYKEALTEQLSWLKLNTPIDLTFTYYKGSKRLSDRSNVLSIQEKFLCDALTEFWVIKDDNDEFISATHYKSGWIDKENPRVEVTIK